MSDKASITCKRCGVCCLADASAYILQEDRNRWQKEGRRDILHVLERKHALWAGDHLVSDDGKYLKGCVFLTWDTNRYACSIYETRPKICREYIPGSSAICPQFCK